MREIAHLVKMPACVVPDFLIHIPIFYHLRDFAHRDPPPPKCISPSEIPYVAMEPAATPGGSG
jgi:hypothetical protein